MRASVLVGVGLLNTAFSIACERASDIGEANDEAVVADRQGARRVPADSYASALGAAAIDTVGVSGPGTPALLLVRPVILSPGGSSTYEVLVSSCDSLSVKVVTSSNAAELSLTDPSGADVRSPKRRGVRVEETTRGGEHLAVWAIEHPEPGRWKVEVGASSGPALGLLTVSEHGGPAVDVTCKRSVPPGGTQTIEIQVDMDGEGIAGAAVSANVAGADGFRCEIELVDDGVSPDRLNGDGVYTGSFAVGDHEGQYSVDVWASAALPDRRRLNRAAEGRFQVATFADVTFGEPGVVIKPIRVDGTFPIEVTLTNFGNGPAEGVTVRFYDNSGGWPIGWTTVENLRPNEQRALNHQIPRRSYHVDSVSVCVRLHVTGAHLEPVIENNERCASRAF